MATGSARWHMGTSLNLSLKAVIHCFLGVSGRLQRPGATGPARPVRQTACVGEPNHAWEKIRTVELVSLARENKKEKKDWLYEVVEFV